MAAPDLDFDRDPAVLGPLLEDLEDGLFSVDARGVLVGWSPAAARLTGFRRDEVVGRTCATFDDAGTGLGEVVAWLAGPRAERLRLSGPLVARGGRQLAIRGTARLVRDDAGVVVGAIGAFREVAVVASPTAADDGPIGGFVGTSEPMREVVRRLRLAAHSDVTTLITGESGTGKEVVARAVHDLGERRERPFVAVHCAALPESLLESELFGHVKGAFTGAVRDRAGVLEAADTGTLFLDEIGDVSPLIQVKLLRVLQEREVRRLGGDRTTKIDVRLVTATNKDLRALLDDGRLREDFYYRIRVYEIAIPPLRERLADLPALVDHFVHLQNERTGRHVRGASHDALRRMLDYDWPGNVRELRNTVEHAFVSVAGDWIGLDDLPEDVLLGPAGVAVRTERVAVGPARDGYSPRDRDERARILAELETHRWNRIETAQALGYSRVTLWKKMRKYRIDEGVFRRGG